MKTHFSIKIHQLRCTQKKTIDESASALHLSSEQLLMLETGEMAPSAETVVMFAKYYLISIDELLGYPDTILPLRETIREYRSQNKDTLSVEDIHKMVTAARELIINTNDFNILSEAYEVLEYAYKIKGDSAKAQAIAEHRSYCIC